MSDPYSYDYDTAQDTPWSDDFLVPDDAEFNKESSFIDNKEDYGKLEQELNEPSYDPYEDQYNNQLNAEDDLRDIFVDDDDGNPLPMNEDDDEEDELQGNNQQDSNAPLPLWKRLLYGLQLLANVGLLPFLVYGLWISFFVYIGVDFRKISAKDFAIGSAQTAIVLLEAVVVAFLWIAWCLLVPLPFVNRILLPISFLVQIISLIGVVVVSFMALKLQITSRYAVGFFLAYTFAMIFILPVWIFRYKNQKQMLSFLSTRLIFFLLHHKISILFVIVMALIQMSCFFTVLVFSSYWFINLPVCIFTSEVIRNATLYAICALDSRYMKTEKSNVGLSISTFFEPFLFKMFWIMLCSVCSFLQPLILAARNISLAILSCSIGLNYGLLWIVRFVLAEKNPNLRKQYKITLLVIGIVFGLWIVLALLISWILTFFALIFYSIIEVLVTVTTRSSIGSMALFNESWPKAIIRNFKTKRQSVIFTGTPLSEGTNILEKMFILVKRFFQTVVEDSEQNNIMLFVVDCGNTLAGSFAGIAGYFWIRYLGPTDDKDDRDRYHIYFQSIPLCFFTAFYISSTVLSLVEGRILSLYWTMKCKDLNLLSQFTKQTKERLREIMHPPEDKGPALDDFDAIAES